jgi:hypothetical protein
MLPAVPEEDDELGRGCTKAEPDEGTLTVASACGGGTAGDEAGRGSAGAEPGG